MNESENDPITPLGLRIVAGVALVIGTVALMLWLCFIADVRLIVYQLTGVFGSVASDPDENPVPVAMTLIVA